MISSFHPDMPLSEIVQQAPAGILCFHNHYHWGSYQLLIRSMQAFKESGVKHFYLEISLRIFQSALDHHFSSGGKSDALDQVFSVFGKNDQMTHVKSLIEAAHGVGIQVLAVDINEVLNEDSHLGGDTKRAEFIVNERKAHDHEMAELMRSHMQRLASNDKYIGLFGGNHASIGQIFNACLVGFQAIPLEDERTHRHMLVADVIGSDERSHAILQQFHILTLVPQDLDDKIDLSQPIENSRSLGYLNRLLHSLSLPECQAYRHTNSQKVSAAVYIKFEELETIWPAFVERMDPFAKRCDTSLDPSRPLIIFDDIDQDSVRAKIVTSLVSKLKPSQEKSRKRDG